MTIQHYEPPAPLPASRPGDEHAPGPVGWVARLRAAAEIAGHIAETDFVPQPLRGNAPAIAAAILYGDEVGLTPMQSLAKVAVIRGRPTLTAEGQRGLVTSAGHEIWFDESTTTRAIAAGRRRGEERVARITWTLDDAKRAGIAGGENWRRYPAEMLRARASAALCRAAFADVIGGMPASEEMEDEPERANGVAPGPQVDTGEPAAPPRAPARRRRTTAQEPAPPQSPAGSAPTSEPVRGPVAPTPPPDTQPEPAVPDEPLATDAHRRRIFASMRDLGFPDDRDRVLAYVSHVVGRPIASRNELTIGEAGRLIEQLDADKAKRLAGEQALVDEIIRTFDARVVADERRDTTPSAGEEAPADAPPAPTPAGPEEGNGGGDAGDPGPVPYNEFPQGY